MRDEKTIGDELLYQPPSGFGAKLMIQYKLPRHT